MNREQVQQVDAKTAEKGNSPAGIREITWQGDDEALLLLCQQKRPGVATVLYDRFGKEIHRLVWHLLGPDSEHEDLVHTIFINILQGIHRLRSAQSLHAWCVSVTINTTRSEIRKRSRQRMFFRPEKCVDMVADHTPNPEDRDLLRRTFSLLSHLPSKERIAFVLRYIEENTLAQVAACCDCSLATAKRRISRAQKRFRKMAQRDPALAERLGDKGRSEPC